MKQEEEWNEYFKVTEAKPPSEVAKKAFNQLNAKNGIVVDLGCGAGNDSLYFLQQGYQVVAVDSETAFVKQRKEEMPKEIQDRFAIAKMKFEEMELPKLVDAVIANYSLPFCNSDSFSATWEKIVQSIKEEGIFSGVFFGTRDGWVNEMKEEFTFLSMEQVQSLFRGFTIIECKEQEYEGVCLGEHGERIPKHWHIIRVLAKRQE